MASLPSFSPTSVSRITSAPARLAADPRHFQILALGSLLAYAAFGPGFVDDPVHVLVLLLGCLGTQVVLHPRGTPLDLRSPAITVLSLSLLLRVDHWGFALAAAVIAIASKRVLRVRGRHIFNPAALAITVLVLGTEHVWVSPGQWGHAAHAGLAIAGAGLLVLTRAARLDVCAAFLLCWGATLLLRALWLGDPLSIPLHQLSNGALLLFAFFMITDPRSTPRARAGRLLFAGIVSITAAALMFLAYRADGLILALALCAPLVPLLDHLFPGPAHRWSPTAR